MDITITEEDSQLIAAFDGRLDTVAAQKISETIEPLMQNADKTLILDCEKMPFISSSGLRIFIKIRKETVAKGGKMYLRKVNNDVKQVLKMTKLDEVFELLD